MLTSLGDGIPLLPDGTSWRIQMRSRQTLVEAINLHWGVSSSASPSGTRRRHSVDAREEIRSSNPPKLLDVPYSSREDMNTKKQTARGRKLHREQLLRQLPGSPYSDSSVEGASLTPSRWLHPPPPNSPPLTRLTLRHLSQGGHTLCDLRLHVHTYSPS